MIAWRNTPSAFGLPARLLHWLTALALTASFALVWTWKSLPAGAPRGGLVDWHRAIGLAVLGLATLRLLCRLADRRPTRARLPRALRLLATLNHALLYAILLANPLVGWFYTNAGGYSVSLFGWTLPAIMFRDRYLAGVAVDLHETLGWALLALIALHIAAALGHGWRRDGVLSGMLVGPPAARPPS